MAETWILESSVAFGDVDADNLLTLQGVFQLLQEAAIAHANQHDTGTDAMITRGESWVLNRVAVEISRYPGYGERVRVETWSSGIRGFKGYRDFRVFDAAGQVIVAGSSLWLYVSVRTHAIIRVPRQIAERFPVAAEGVFCPDIESLGLPAPEPDGALSCALSLRYSDFDANAHLNNTAYLDLLQAALARHGLNPRPRSVHIKYGKAIPARTPAAEVRLDPAPVGPDQPVRFSIHAGPDTCAQGEVG